MIQNELKLSFNSQLILHYTPELDRAEHAFPFLVQYQRNGKKLSFVAADHAFDLQSNTHRLINLVFANQVPDAIVLEGFSTAREPAWDSELESYYINRAMLWQQSNNGTMPESYYALLKGKTANSIIFSGEPTEEAQITHLVKQGYSPDDYCCVMFLWRLGQWREEGLKQTDIPKIWTENYISYKNQVSGCLSVDIGSFELWFYKRTGATFSLSLIDNHFIAPIISQPHNTIQNIAGHMSHFRDINILSIISASLAKCYHTMVVYGGSHYWTLQPALDEQLGKPEMIFP